MRAELNVADNHVVSVPAAISTVSKAGIFWNVISDIHVSTEIRPDDVQREAICCVSTYDWTRGRRVYGGLVDIWYCCVGIRLVLDQEMHKKLM